MHSAAGIPEKLPPSLIDVKIRLMLLAAVILLLGLFPWRDILQKLAISILIIIVLAWTAGKMFRFFIASPYEVHDVSMEPLLEPGDRVMANRLINTFTFGTWEPDYNELVISRHPLQPEQKILKRVIAMSGDIIEIKDKEISVNETPYERKQFYRESLAAQNFYYDPRTNFAPLSIPGPGDTLDLSELDMREFDFAVSLIRQENPGEQLEVVCDLQIDDETVEPDQFQSMFQLILSEQKELDLSTMDWYNLLSLRKQLEKRFPETSVGFQRTLHMNDQSLILYVVKSPCYFLIGDNLENSHDSRFWGYLSRKLLLSSPFIIYWSKEPGSYFTLKLNRLLKFID